MEEIGKEEGKPMEEGHHDLAQVEEPKPNSVDSVIVEMQKLIGDDGGVQMPADVSAPTVAEVADIVTETNDEMQGDTGSDKVVESEMSLKVESDDKVVGNAESEVPVKMEIDNAVSNVDPEVCLENASEDNGEKGEGVKDVNVGQAVELGAGAESDNLVGNGDGEKGEGLKDVTAEADNLVDNGDGGSHHTAQTTVEIDKEDNDGKALKDGVKAYPSSDISVSQVVPDMCSGGDVAKEKLMDGVSSKVNPSTEPLASAEIGKDVCKLEPDMPRDSKVAREKQVDVVISKAKRSPNEQPSSGKASTVCKVERSIPQDNEVSMETESESDDEDERRHALTGGLSSGTKFSQHHGIKEQLSKSKFHVGTEVGIKNLVPERTFLLDPGAEGDESGTEEEQAEFLKEVENLYREKHLEFKTPKFYKEELNLLKLWRAVIKLGGYEKVTSCKLWRQVGESFNPPKTCTTVSWTFRIFYEKALLEFEKQRWHGNELPLPEPSRVEIRGDGSQTCGSGRTLRDAAARAMQGWHSQRLFANGEEEPLSTMPKSDKLLKSSGLLKRKKLSPGDSAAQVTDMKATRQRLDMAVFDIGPPAEWVKINVKRFSDCFEIYALVPGLLREEVHVQSDPIGRLIISGQPMQLDNPWGVTPFKKVVSLPSRIDPHQTSAVVTLNGQLFVRVPFEQSDF